MKSLLRNIGFQMMELSKTQDSHLPGTSSFLKRTGHICFLLSSRPQLVLASLLPSVTLEEMVLLEMNRVESKDL